jgi:hypothetical protein
MMKVYQCIRAYDPYIPAFENKYNIKGNNYSFVELRDLLIKDGFASTYILKPAFENDKDFFFTFWNYKTLQFKWAQEKGLKTTDLDEIRIAQIDDFNPDVYYNFSTYYDNAILESILKRKGLVSVCWDATIGSFFPPVHQNYDLRATLYEPFLKYWNQHGFKSVLLPPAFPDSWNELDQTKKDIDILFYGQINEHFFSGRNAIIDDLLKWNNKKGYKLKMHLQLPKQKKPLINVRGFNRFAHWLPVATKAIRQNALPPIYGQELYETIARSKIVVNAFGNFNVHHKENMRNYESIGCGAVMIGEDGIYPDHFEPNKDFYTYRTTNELFAKIDQVLSLPDQGTEMVKNARNKLRLVYSKEEQWNGFVEAVNSLDI